MSKELSSHPTPEFDAAVGYEKNENRNEDAPKKKVNVMFLISTLLFIIGLLLCIAAGVLTLYIWCHKRNGGKCDSKHLQVNDQPGRNECARSAIYDISFST